MCEVCGKPIGAGASRRSRGRASASTTSARQTLDGPASASDIRVGSSTDGLTPVSVAERSLGAGAWQWAGSAVVAGAAIAADQMTKHVVTTTLALDDSVHVLGPLSIHHVQNPGIAFGLFSVGDRRSSSR